MLVLHVCIHITPAQSIGRCLTILDAVRRWRCLNKLRELLACEFSLALVFSLTFTYIVVHTHTHSHIKSSKVLFWKRVREISYIECDVSAGIRMYIVAWNMLYCSTHALSLIRYTRISNIHLFNWNRILDVNICVNTNISRSLTNIIRCDVLLLLVILVIVIVVPLPLLYFCIKHY